MSSQYITGLCYMLEEEIGSGITKAGHESLLEKDDAEGFRQFIRNFWTT